ncbi:glycerol dehydrogenase [Trichococcus ilyis]|uniref:Glycerol dehydrogenase n=1 Tax=Trichococcus ilyis TaxID=640938 RepID=A0A143Z1U0_9LACT|nr:glycerol dehydrogenase [Trichococcus ilyis]CZR04497.1 alcohol dehydrogenase iron-type [Trichococcus ilyis]SEJ56420.1 glycerol 2-dehydrogenase (NAD+) [Trichococcus ilyis]
MAYRVFRSPNRYIQGVGAIEVLGKETAVYGEKAFLLTDDFVWGLLQDKVERALEGFPYHYEAFTGEASLEEMVRLADAVADTTADVIIGLGGGKIIDVAKGIAAACELPVVIVPTTVSTDAPTSAISVLYTPDGLFDHYCFYDKNPELVLVDTQIVIQAPLRFFASGMADALATCAEALATQASGEKALAGGLPTLAGTAIAKACEETLFRDGIHAFADVQNGLVTPAVEAIVEANTLLSGLGFENGGLAAAHAIHNGFTAIKGEVHRLTHGEIVGFCLLVQLVLEGRPHAEFAKYSQFLAAIGMPTTLAEMHLAGATREELLAVGKLAVSQSNTMRNLNKNITAEQVADAILAVDGLVGKE